MRWKRIKKRGREWKATKLREAQDVSPGTQEDMSTTGPTDGSEDTGATKRIRDGDKGGV